MRFVIVGASGFVGRHLFRRCRADGHPVMGTQTGARHPELVRFDLARDRILDKIPKPFLTPGQPTYAVICAGITQIDRCIRERKLSRLVNVTNTTVMLRDLVSVGVKPVFVSTGFIFDGASGGYTEDATPGPVNEYGRQRLEVERFLARELPDTLVVRLDKVVGDDPREPHLLTEWYEAVQKQETILCIDGQVFAPTLVDDIARAIVLGCQLGLRGVYHVANTERFTRTELAQEFLRRLGRATPIESRTQDQLGFLEPRPLRTYLDVGKFQAATHLSFAPVSQILQTFVSQLLPTS